MAPAHRSHLTQEKVSDFSGVYASARKSFLVLRPSQKNVASNR
jgi:hypothetical protein